MFTSVVILRIEKKTITVLTATNMDTLFNNGTPGK